MKNNWSNFSLNADIVDALLELGFKNPSDVQ